MSIEVRVLDRTHKLGCEPHQEQNIQYAATLLNQKLKDIRDKMPRLDNEQVFLFVALDLVQDIVQLNKSLQDQTTCQRIVKQLITETEQALSSDNA